MDQICNNGPRERALERLPLPEMLEPRVATLACLGRLAHQQSNQETIQVVLGKLLELQHATDDPAALNTILSELGSLHEALGNVESALSAYHQALKICLATNDPIAIGAARGRVARLAIQQNNSRRGLRATQRHALQEDPHPAPRSEVDTNRLQPKLLRKRAVVDPVYADPGMS